MSTFIANSASTPGGSSPDAVAVSKYGRFLLVASSVSATVWPYYNINHTESISQTQTQHATENETSNATETVNTTDATIDPAAI